MKKLFLVVILCSSFLLIGNTASAIPTLGVAPGAPGSGGVYFGPEPTSGSYFWTFADTFAGGTDGFAMPSSGGELSIWYGKNNGSVNKDKDVWLATTSANGGTFQFSGVSFGLAADNNLSVAGYKPDVYGIYLGTINTPNTALGISWTELTDGEFGTGKKDFWVLTGTLDYSGFASGDWMYAVTTGSPVDDFSPRTTASTVPEPTTMLLLGAGLVGLAGFGRKRFKK